MSGRAHSYIGEGRGRQTIAHVTAIAALALTLGGCAGLGLPLGERVASGPMAYTGSIKPVLASAVAADQANPSDWDAIRRTIDGAPKTAARLDWSNVVSGSAGSIAIAADTGDDCRRFATTINDLRGIRRYRGSACAGADGRSQLRGVVADDATLS